MTGANSSVKMSPYGKGDGNIEREGTATGNGIEPGGVRRTHRGGSCQADGLVVTAGTKAFGSLQEGGGYCPGPWQSRPSAGPPDIRGYQEVGRGPGSRYIPRVEPLPPTGAQREELVLSRSSLWRILTEARVARPRRCRRPQHRHRRERYPQEGMLL